MPIRILIADDDPDIRDVLKLTLSEENYEILEASNGEEALKIIQNKPVDMALLDYKMPKLDGRQLCGIIKSDLLLRHLPIIMVTGKGEVSDKVGGIEAGADDYIVKPFEPKELLARMRMILRRTTSDLEANPLTRLPGNISILNELNKRIEKNKPFAVCYVDLDKFKAYNDKYGFEHGDDVIRETARILIRALQKNSCQNDFIGHIGGDDFVVVTAPETVNQICQTIIDEFDKTVPSFYSAEDNANGFIVGCDRKGKLQKITLLSVSIGVVVSNQTRLIKHVAEIGEIGAELKKAAKALEKSNYVIDKRRD
ncbi:MAG: response regulator [Candidatus Omnitrophica bacterium]|jgi:diguanylate cyclase (GGDEF)-like protein|nr:response regulator [Candidatus Omnitrophota bacterium]